LDSSSISVILWLWLLTTEFRLSQKQIVGY